MAFAFLMQKTVNILTKNLIFFLGYIIMKEVSKIRRKQDVQDIKSRKTG